MIIAYAFAMHAYWSPAHPGTDQNGYLVGGKLLAASGSSGFKPADPYLFVGRMWIESDSGKFFPKYPVGLSLIYAITLKIGGAKYGLPLTFMISPVAMTLALAATFLLIRLAAGSFAAILGTIILSTSAVTLGLTNNPNSHATAICFVAWGMYFLFRWWQSNGLARAIAAGFFLGMAVTIRYTEGLLVLPLVLVLLFNLHWKNKKSWIESALLAGAWLLPVVALVAYNWFSFHHITGYDPTNESTGFSWEDFQNNWEVMVRQIYTTGLFFIIPFSIFGLVMMWRMSWRFSVVLLGWIVPNLALYSAYYWAPDGTSIAYLRFFLTIFPALVLAAAWCLKRLVDLGAGDGAHIAPKIAVAVVICIGCAYSLGASLAELENDSQANAALNQAAQTVGKICPAGSTIFSFVPDRMLNFVQLTGDYNLYEGQQFTRQGIQRLANVDPTQPNGLQPQRAKEMYARTNNASDADLMHTQNKLMTDALSQGQRVFLLVNRNNPGAATHFLPKRIFTSATVGTWEEPPTNQRVMRRQRANGGFVQRWQANVDQTKPALCDILEVKLVPQKPTASR